MTKYQTIAYTNNNEYKCINMMIYAEGFNNSIFDVNVASTFWQRFMGLLGTTQLMPRQGLFIKNTKQIHTIGMKYPIDCIFIDKDFTVIGIEWGMRPYRISSYYPDALGVIELASNEENKKIFKKFIKIIKKSYD